MQLTKGERVIGSGFLLLTGSFAFFDALSDIAQGSSWSHVALEVTAGIVLLSAFIWLWVSQRQTMDGLIKSSALRSEELKREADHWRKEASQLSAGLSRAIDDQFARWQLTQAEAAIARLILKGLSNKEIAAVREASEQTIKQQAHAIYKKSGLESRSQLLAFFLEDLF